MGGTDVPELEEVLGGKVSCKQCKMSHRNEVHKRITRPDYHEYVEPPTPEHEPSAKELLIDRITNYLVSGGLFNPEYMEHDKVRELLIDCRDEFYKG